MEEKIEEIEAEYDTLIEMQPDDERKYLEKKNGNLRRSDPDTREKTTTRTGQMSEQGHGK